MPPCTDLVRFRRVCDHVVSDVPCAKAFGWAADPDHVPPCKELVDIVNPLCGHDMRVDCSIRSAITQWQPWGTESDGPPLGAFELVTDSFDANGDAQTALVINESALDEPPMLKHGCGPAVDCRAPAIITKRCGHKQRLSCTDAFRTIGAQCTDAESVLCVNCNRGTEYPCHVAEAIRAGTIANVCKLIGPKMCTRPRCGNVVDVECFRTDVECKRSTSMVLQCGHSFSWHCGEDPPPDDPPCIECQIPKWEKAVEELNNLKTSLENKGKRSDATNAEHALRKVMRDVVERRVMEELPSHKWTEEDSTLADIPLMKMVNGRREVLAKYFDLLKEQSMRTTGAAAADGAVPEVPVVSAPGLFDTDCYDVVFSSIVSNGKGDLSKAWTPSHTHYAHGTELSLLSADTVNRHSTPNENGVARLLVGVAFRLRVHEAIPPFLPKGKKVNTRMRQSANKNKARKVKEGFDCIDVMDDDGSGDDDGGKVHNRVYWQQAHVPLGVVDVTIKQQCMLCMEQFFAKEGLFCTKHHFLCAECLGGYVASASDPDAVTRSTDEQGNVRCPCDECDEMYVIYELAQQPGAEAARGIIDQLVDLRSQFRMKQELPAALEAERARLKAEFDEIMRMEGDNRTVHLIRFDIVDNILNLKCPAPGCGAVFNEFTGCFALTCHRCRAGFCAWCLQHCGRDAHEHCRTVHGDYFGTQAQFIEAQRERRERLVRARLANEEPRIRDLVLDLMRKDLADLGIHV